MLFRSVIDAGRQDDFYSLMIAVQSFYEAYSREVSVNESWDDCQASFGYQLETLRSQRRPRFLLTGRQMEALQPRHYSWRVLAITFDIECRIVLF